jgi:hypothetical protein
MRSIFVGATMAAALGLALPTSASPFKVGGVESANGGVQHIQYGRERSRYCERLRRDCAYKDERGERGEGNCRRYREVCR